MSDNTLMNVCAAPVYALSRPGQTPELVLDKDLLRSRITDDSLDLLSLLIRSRDGVTGEDETIFDDFFGATDDFAVISLFDEDHDADSLIENKRRGLATDLLNQAINRLFVQVAESGSATIAPHPAIHLLARAGEQRARIVVITDLTEQHDAEEVEELVGLFDAIAVFDALDLFHEPFERPAGEDEAGTLSVFELEDLNDKLTQRLWDRGWVANSDEDYDALNELTHAAAEHQRAIDTLVNEFLGQRIIEPS